MCGIGYKLAHRQAKNKLILFDDALNVRRINDGL